MASKPTITRIRPADENNQVVTVAGGAGNYCKTPCPQCPWRIDQVGAFPAEAFRHSATTCADMAQEMFACHMAGKENPTTCAGFLLRGATHNLAFRIAVAQGRIDPRQVSDGGVELHANYRAMAEANGVEADDAALKGVRDA